MANKSLAAAQKAFDRGQKARASAAKRGVVTTQRPQKKKKRREEEEPVRQQPKQTSMSKPKVSKEKATARPTALQKATTTNLSERYNSFTKSTIAPKITNTSKTVKDNKPKSNLEDAQQAYQKGKNRTYLGTNEKTTTTKVGKTTLKSKNALRMADFQRMEVASRYGKNLGNKILKGNKNLGQKDIREKVGSKTAESAYKGKFITGAMQGSGFADVIHGSVGTYNKQAKKAIKKTTESKAYMGGYVAGQIGGFGLTQTGAAGKALAQGTIKAGAKATGKGLAKKFAKNRAGEMIAESPMNALDAVKMSTDENGKLDKKQVAKFMALNTGLTGAAGGALEGAAMKRATSNTKKLTELLGKQQAGTITDAEVKQLKKVREAVRKSAQNTDNLGGEISAKGLEDIKTSASEARIGKAKARSAAIAEERKAIQEVKRQNQSVADLYNRTQSPTKNMTEISAERNKVARAQKDIDKINAAEAEAKNLPSSNELADKLKDANNRLDELKAQRANPNVEGASKTIDDSIAKVEKEIDELKRQENVVWSADRQQSRKATLQETIDNANKKIDELSETSQAPDPKKVERDIQARKDFEEKSKALADAEDKLSKANDALRGALAHGRNSRKAHGEISPQTKAEIETAKKAKAEAQAAYDAAKTASDEAHSKVKFAALSDEYADEVGIHARETSKGKNLTEGEVQASELKTMKEDLAQLDDEIALTQRKLANATGDNAGAYRKELDTLRQQRMVIESAIENAPAYDALKQAAQELDKAVKTKKTGVRKLLNKANRAFIDSFGDWEGVFRNIDDPQLRQMAFDKLQKLRMSKAEASSKVFDEFL